MAGLTRLELATSRVTGERSNQTELQPPKDMLFKYAINKFKMACHTKFAEPEGPDKRSMAPRAGLEPATQRLTVVCSTS